MCAPARASACAIVVLDNATGGVRAMVSSSPPQYREVNLALTPPSLRLAADSRERVRITYVVKRKTPQAAP
jgi:P pilus assembly chaperone PapD